MQRRALLQTMLALPVMGAASSRLLAAPAGGSKFLLVFLRGGYDAASLLVPIDSEFYYAVRPNIAIARPDANNTAAALPLDANWGLHPALRDTLLPLYQRGQLAFVPFAGTDDLSRSHFETQDHIELGQVGRAADFNSGFLNRLAAVLGSSNAIAFTDQLPLVMRGPWQVANVGLRNLNRPALEPRQAELIASMYAGTRLAAMVNDGFETRSAVMQNFTREMEAANRGALSARGFEQEARRVGRLLRERYDLGFIDVGGWDTHVGQGAATGYLASRLDELGRGLAALVDELGPRWQDTVVVVVSEFGRTFRENGSRGTDHGHGSVYWVLGGAVAGGRIAGEQVHLAPGSLFQDRDWPVLTDVRALLGGLFARMYGLSPAALERVFPGAEPRALALL